MTWGLWEFQSSSPSIALLYCGVRPHCQELQKQKWDFRRQNSELQSSCGSIPPCGGVVRLLCQGSHKQTWELQRQNWLPPPRLCSLWGSSVKGSRSRSESYWGFELLPKPMYLSCVDSGYLFVPVLVMYFAVLTLVSLWLCFHWPWTWETCLTDSRHF